MTIVCNSWLGLMHFCWMSLCGRMDVPRAWLVFSGAAETALADAYRFAGGPVPVRGLVVGRGTTRFRVVRLGKPEIRKARCNVADASDAGDVFMYGDFSIASVLGLRRRLKAFMDVLDSMIGNEGSLARSVELSVQWDRILQAGPVYPVTLHDFHAGGCAGIGDSSCYE